MLSRLIVAASETNADMLYATGFQAPDAFVYIETPKYTTILLSDLEIDRGRKQARVDSIEAWSDLATTLRRQNKLEPTFAQVVAAFARKHKVTRPIVPANFPAGLAGMLVKYGVVVKPVEGHFWPQREYKTTQEIRALVAASHVAEAGLKRAMEILKASRIRKDRKLEWGGSILTAERLRAEAEAAMLFAGGFTLNNSIIACGPQACDPHERGHGPLRAHELIIIDLFPRIAKTGFYGDLTRTVVRGHANDAQRQIWKICLEGQKRALKAFAPGIHGKTIQDDVRAFFAHAGYSTEQKKGRWQGFFHGLGHGLGLELHEEPRIAATKFTHGQVFTVEPGLYIPGIGGVRHEDVVVITKNGYRMLSHFPKVLEI